MSHNDSARFQRLARNQWRITYTTAVDADAWGQVEDALNEYEK
jgi:hypothetical protein